MFLIWFINKRYIVSFSNQTISYRRDNAAARQAIKDSDGDDRMQMKIKEVADTEHKDKQHDQSITSPDRSMRRSPSYNQALSTDNEDVNDSKTQPKKRYSDGKHYTSVENVERVWWLRWIGSEFWNFFFIRIFSNKPEYQSIFM